MSLRDLSKEWSISGTLITSRATISRSLLDFGLESYAALKKPLLTKADRKIRYQWCLERKDWMYDKWSSVIFSDESNFQN